MSPINLYSADAPKGDKRRVIEFATGEILLEHGVVHRIEFTDKRCNLTLKNPTPKRQAVNVKVWVLNSGLVELWHQIEKWSLTSLQPDQSHLVSWDFKPVVPSVIWSPREREDNLPAWIVIDAI